MTYHLCTMDEVIAESVQFLTLWDSWKFNQVQPAEASVSLLTCFTSFFSINFLKTLHPFWPLISPKHQSDHVIILNKILQGSPWTSVPWMMSKPSSGLSRCSKFHAACLSVGSPPNLTWSFTVTTGEEGQILTGSNRLVRGKQSPSRSIPQ